MAWAIKRPSGKWQGKYRTADGKQRSAGTYPTKREALKQATLAEASPLTSDMTWGAWVEHWWPSRSIEAATESSERFMVTKHVAPAWAHVPLDEITRHGVQTWATSLAGDVSPASARRILGVLVSSLSSAVDAGLMHANPATRIKLPPVEQGREVFLTHEQFDLLLECVPHKQEKALLTFLANTGLRWGEAAGLHWENIDLDRGIITVQHTFNKQEIKPYPKSRKQRHVPLFDWVADMLPRQAGKACTTPHSDGKACKSPLVFPNKSGGAQNDRNFSRRVLHPALEDAGLKHLGMTLHDLRHTYASWLVQGGVTLERIADLLGHSSLNTTQIYAHLAPAKHDELRDALRPGVAPRSESVRPVRAPSLKLVEG